MRNLNNLYEIFDLNNQLGRLNELIQLLKNIETNSENKIERGCRIRCIYQSGISVEGRVWKVEGESVYVNRDGYKGEMIFDKKDIINLSVDLFGILEKERWIIKGEISSLKHEIKSNNFEPFEFSISEYNEVVKYEILNVSEIKSTNAKLITYRRIGTDVVEKTISNSKALENLTIGEYEFKFNSGVLTSINKFEN